MTFAPCCTKSSCKARMNFSFSLLRLPIDGQPDYRTDQIAKLDLKTSHET
jgi:hypothetical protein